ncbi:MAG TPA: response regulator [Thermodesulfobacteriota bacterium]|nr:response regulator [Thermodesulfobacteriota bacterium]
MPKKRILIVENNKIQAKLYKQILETEGFKVEVARDGVEGLEKVKEDGYDVIISDMNMPRMNGEEFYLGVKKLNQDLADKIIFITGFMTDFIKSTGNKYIQKPAYPKQLVEAARKLTPQGCA